MIGRFGRSHCIVLVTRVAVVYVVTITRIGWYLKFQTGLESLSWLLVHPQTILFGAHVPVRPSATYRSANYRSSWTAHSLAKR